MSESVCVRSFGGGAVFTLVGVFAGKGGVPCEMGVVMLSGGAVSVPLKRCEGGFGWVLCELVKQGGGACWWVGWGEVCTPLYVSVWACGEWLVVSGSLKPPNKGLRFSNIIVSTVKKQKTGWGGGGCLLLLGNRCVVFSDKH